MGISYLYNVMILTKKPWEDTMLTEDTPISIFTIRRTFNTGNHLVFIITTSTTTTRPGGAFVERGRRFHLWYWYDTFPTYSWIGTVPV